MGGLVPHRHRTTPGRTLPREGTPGDGVEDGRRRRTGGCRRRLSSVARGLDRQSATWCAWTLFTYGFAIATLSRPPRYEALRRGLRIAQDSGSRMTEATIPAGLSPLAINQGDHADALGYLTLSLRYYHDSGAASGENALAPLIVISTDSATSRRRRCAGSLNTFTRSYRPRSPMLRRSA